TGDTYELHNAMNYFGDVIIGTYNGSSISVSMTGHAIGAPSGLPAPKSPFPEFGAFVLIKKASGAVGNTAPTIATIGNQAINAGTSTAPLALTVSDAETAAGNLAVTVGSWNTTLVPLSNIVLGGSGSNRTVTVTPAAGQTGATQIDLIASDGILKTTTSFALTINAVAVNTLPTISSIGSQTINAGTSTGPLAFTVGDAQ